MPREIKSYRRILDAIERADILCELVEKYGGCYEHELDLEVIVYGRNYNGKKVGPYVHLYEFDPGDEVIREGDWGGNTFYVLVDGRLDVYVADTEGGQNRIGTVPPGKSFGEGSLLAGVPRDATVVVPEGGAATVFEVDRPALRLLRKLRRFGRELEQSYGEHGLRRMGELLRREAGQAFDNELLQKLGDASRFKTFGRHSVLCREGGPIDRIIIIVEGWLRRTRGMATARPAGDPPPFLDWDLYGDFIGPGNCLGLEGVQAPAAWDYTATVLQRLEVLEISVARLRAEPKLLNALRQSFLSFQLADDALGSAKGAPEKLALAAAEKEIDTGIIQAANLLVMDMDKCVRCGNCSMACHQVHGHSRLLRRGIFIQRPKTPGSSVTQQVLAPSVCMHCQDPECLTGCPTGAIGRFGNGQIDIDPKTCIGCGDCAAQCPYDAITMVSRRPPLAPPKPLAKRLSSLFLDRRCEAAPEPVTEIENLVAITCNLCHGTPLNPYGARTHVYSCEENCPTGALARVNPREYFKEAGRRISLFYRDQTHVIGRNLHHHDRVAKFLRLCGVAAVTAIVIAAVAGLKRYGLDAPINSTRLTMRWVTGLGGLFGIAVALAYHARRQVYRLRAVPLRYWLQLHAYAGVAAGLLLLLHAGGTPGGALTRLLALSLYMALLSGVFGAACYYLCPRLMTDLEGEPLLIEDLQARKFELLEKLGNINAQFTPESRSRLRSRVYRRFFTLSFLLRQYIRREPLSALLAASREEMLDEFEGIPDRRIRNLAVDAVEVAVTLNRVKALIYLHQLLRLWVVPHVWAAALTTALMFVHIAQVLYAAAAR